MKERPILFTGEMVRAILDGRKTTTRRVIKPQPAGTAMLPHEWGKVYGDEECGNVPFTDGKWGALRCPYGKPGDRLWVRETWAPVGGQDRSLSTCTSPKDVYFKASTEEDVEAVCVDRWRPSIHMPRWASRITLEITEVRVEGVQDISRGDCMAEGCPFPNMADGENPRDWFRDLWDSINKKRGFGWDANPWVWVVEFALPSGGG